MLNKQLLKLVIYFSYQVDFQYLKFNGRSLECFGIVVDSMFVIDHLQPFGYYFYQNKYIMPVGNTFPVIALFSGQQSFVVNYFGYTRNIDIPDG
jgi:hypothetical protein